MNKTYIITWKSKSSGSVGRGKRLFSSEEAEQVAKELNEDHPDFLHEPFNLGSSITATTEPENSAVTVSTELSPMIGLPVEEKAAA